MIKRVKSKRHQIKGEREKKKKERISMEGMEGTKKQKCSKKKKWQGGEKMYN